MPLYFFCFNKRMLLLRMEGEKMAYLSTVTAIPAMTSNTAPSGIASSSTPYNTSTEAYHAFNQVQSSSAWVANSGTASWIQYEFPTAKLIKRYSFKSDGYNASNTRAPKSWTFEASNDGVNWVVLDTQSNQTGWGLYTIRTFDITNNTKYKIYRVNITSNNGHTTMTGIDEIEMFEFVYENKCLLLNEGKIKSIEPIRYPDNLVPKMTSNTLPSGIASASSESATNFAAWYAFNGAKGSLNPWQSTTAQCWIRYQFTEKIVVNMYTLTSDIASRTDSMAKSWTFEGSDTGASWVILDSRSDEIGWTEYETRTYTFNNKTRFQIYRLNISDSTGTRVYLNEFEIYHYIYAGVIETDKTSAVESDFLRIGFSGLYANIEKFDKIIDTTFTNSTLGTGKTFEHTIDLSKRKIDRISF